MSVEALAVGSLVEGGFANELVGGFLCELEGAIEGMAGGAVEDIVTGGVIVMVFSEVVGMLLDDSSVSQKKSYRYSPDILFLHFLELQNECICVIKS